jgi:hypothetical protein
MSSQHEAIRHPIKKKQINQNAPLQTLPDFLSIFLVCVDKLLLPVITMKDAKLLWVLYWITTLTRIDAYHFPVSSSRRRVSPLQATKTRVGRQNRIQELLDWAKNTADIKAGGIELKSSPESGLGWFATRTIPANSVLLSVPSALVLSVEGTDGPPQVEKLVDRSIVRTLPWYARMSLYLHYLSEKDPTISDVNIQPWLDSLPTQFDTPLHWGSLKELQYPYMEVAVAKQKKDWEAYHKQMQGVLSWEDFVWGCECARSRAFSGAYTGGAFNPRIYVFTLLLVMLYVGLNLGTLEQAANGAGVVVSASIFKDFVVPKLFKQQRYIICPVIDMANHQSIGSGGEVSFEYFANAYSLASSKEIPAGKEVTISYGKRSNDQLLQYYGFVEQDNSNDVYILPALREWDIETIEKNCGRKVAAGRLAKLERAGLLGSTVENAAAKSNEEAANAAGGVVVKRGSGVDPAVLQALRALLSTDEEWSAASEAIGNFVEPVNPENEKCARIAARTALEQELSNKATTLEEDETLLQRMESMKKATDSSVEDLLAIQFRIEKKKLLQETIDRLR